MASMANEKPPAHRTDFSAAFLRLGNSEVWEPHSQLNAASLVRVRLGSGVRSPKLLKGSQEFSGASLRII
jgi:hypothetical protein